MSHIFYTSLVFGGDCTSCRRIFPSKLICNPLQKKSLVSRLRPLADLDEQVKVPCKGAGRGVAWAKIDDLGEATARLVQSYIHGNGVNEYQNKIVLLSGPKVYSIAETVAFLLQ